jgi:hypothetical protein
MDGSTLEIIKTVFSNNQAAVAIIFQTMNIEEIEFNGLERIYFDVVDQKSEEQLISCKFKGGTARKDNDSIYQYMYFYFTSIGLNITATGGVKIRFEIIVVR